MNDPAKLHTAFRLTLGKHEALQILSFRAVEAMGKGFRIDVRGWAHHADDDFAEKLVDEPATLTFFEGDDAVRALHGIVERSASVGVLSRGEQVVSLRIAPALARLKRRTTRRIFQDQTSIDIALAVLHEWKVPVKVKVQGAVRRRAYCVQYDESDYAFLHRLFAQEGFVTFFDHAIDEDKAKLVVADGPHAYLEMHPKGPLFFARVEAGSARHGRPDQVTAFEPRARSATEKLSVRGYDFLKPDNLPKDEAGKGERGSHVFDGSYETDAFQRPAGGRLEQLRRKASGAEGGEVAGASRPG